jgi:hypothetical protein
MDRVTILQGRLVVWVLAAALALAVAVVVPRATSAAPPEPVDETPFVLEGFCDFPVQVEETGKTKEILLPDESLLLTAPGARIVLTNLLTEPDKQVSLVNTGTLRLRELENGNLSVVGRGHNVLFDPGEGIFLTIGRVELLLTPTDDPDVYDITILENQGRLIDVCALLE